MNPDRFFNPTPTFHKYDRFITGFLPGLILPLIVFPLFFFVRGAADWATYWSQVTQPVVLSPILSLGCIVNLAFFFTLISRNYYNAARGAVFSTLLYILPILYFKFFA